MKRRWYGRGVSAYLLACAIILAACGTAPRSKLPLLLPSVGDHAVLYVGSGQGSRVIHLAVPTVKKGSLVPGGVISIVAVCSGTGDVTIKLEPGGESDSPSCGGVGGGWSIAGPAKLSWPDVMVVHAGRDTTWRIAVVDPYGSTGVSQSAK